MSKKYVYLFSEGNKDMRNLLGGKGANLAEMEAAHIRATLEACGGNKKLAAEKLGISRSTLYEKLKECPIPGQPCSGGGHETA